MNKELIASIIRIIHVRSAKNARATLIYEIQQHDQSLDFTLLSAQKIRNETFDKDNIKHLTQYHPIEKNGHIAESPIEFSPQSKDFNTLIYPIHVNNYTIEYLLFNETELNADANELIGTLMLVYKNHVELIYEGGVDQLTELLNRKSFDHISNDLCSSQVVNNEEDAHYIAILDIDHFKKVNDEFGHLYGDEVLLLFAQLMKKVFRISDLLFRYGGEEFAVIFKNTPKAEVHNALERFRVAAESFIYPRVGVKTVSIGYSLIEAKKGISHSLNCADKALYFSKENGRNQTTFYNDIHIDDELSFEELESEIIFL